MAPGSLRLPRLPRLRLLANILFHVGLTVSSTRRLLGPPRKAARGLFATSAPGIRVSRDGAGHRRRGAGGAGHRASGHVSG